MIRFERQIVGKHEEKITAKFEIVATGTVKFSEMDEYGHDLRDIEPETAKALKEDVRKRLTEEINAQILKYVYENLRNPQRLVITPRIKDRLLLIHPYIHEKLLTGEICLRDLFGLPEVKKHERSLRDKEKHIPSSVTVKPEKSES